MSFPKSQKNTVFFGMAGNWNPNGRFVAARVSHFHHLTWPLLSNTHELSDHTWCNRIWDRLHSFTINSWKWENFSYLCCGWNVNKQSMAQNTCSLHLRRCSSVAWSLIYALALCHMLMESPVCFFKRTHLQTLVKTCRKPNPKIHWSRRWLQNVKPIGCKALQHIMAHLRYRTE